MTPLALPRRAWAICLLVTILGTAALCARNGYVFSYPIREDADFAANSILVQQAVHFTLLVGNYSRLNFNHPGPAFLYILSFGQDLFYSLLHVVPTPYNAQVLTTFLLNSAMLALTALIIYRHLRSWWIAILAISAVLIVTGDTLAWASTWMPFLYAAPFLLATVAGVSVAVGAWEDLPLFALAVGMLVHGHVAFIGIAGLYVVVVFACRLVLRRSERRNGTHRAAPRTALLGTGVIVFVFLSPLVLNVALHWPGQWGLYWNYVHSNSQQAHTLTQVVSYVAFFWSGNHLIEALLAAAGIAAAVAVATDPDPRRRLFMAGLLAAVALMTLELMEYAFKGVDDLNSKYIGYFYYTIPPLTVAVLLIEMCTRLRIPTIRLVSPRAAGFATASVLGAVAIAAASWSATRFSFYSAYRGNPSLPQLAVAIANAPERQGRTVAIDLGEPGLPSSDWPDVVGVLMAASRAHWAACVANSGWEFMVTSQFICSSTTSGHAWHVEVEHLTDRDPTGDSGHVMFADQSTMVISRP